MASLVGIKGLRSNLSFSVLFLSLRQSTRNNTLKTGFLSVVVLIRTLGSGLGNLIYSRLQSHYLACDHATKGPTVF